MNVQQSVQSRTSANGFTRRRDMGARIDNKPQPDNSDPIVGTGLMSGNRGGSYQGTSRDRLVYSFTCLIGLHVEVQVKNGSVFSGIFHASNIDKDFGVVLKMARLIKDVSNRGHRAAADTFNKAPSKIQIIPAQELVQVVAKDVPLTKEGINSGLQHEKQELLLDTYISKSRHVEGERQLERWVPDDDDPQNAELEHTFDNPWTGSWDQFKVNETLFGVKSTFNEELYTTKLEKGLRSKELEEAATRIAREIEGEDTQDLHLAEERGIFYQGDHDIDEETRYSSVFRGVDDSGYADEDIMIDTLNDDTFGDSSEPAPRSFADVTSGKIRDGNKVLSSISTLTLHRTIGHPVSQGSLSPQPPYSPESRDGIQSSQRNVSRDVSQSCYVVDDRSGDTLGHDTRTQQKRRNEEDKKAYDGDFARTQTLEEELEASITKDLQSSLNSVEYNPVKRTSSAEATACPASESTEKGQEKASSSSGEPTEDPGSGNVHGTSHSRSFRGKPSSSASPALSPSSSVGSLSSEKSSLNPNAKEFKPNPNAKSFVPSQSPLRPASPVAADNSFYYPANVPSMPPMHGMHVGVGVGPSFPGGQPMMFNPPGAPMQSAPMYYPPNAPQYGQQMFVHPGQVMYMQSYPNEMQYKGREF